MTTYRFNQSYIHSKVRGPIHGAVVFALIVSAVSLAAGLSGSWHPAVAAAVAVFATAFILHKNRKLSREAASRLPQVEVELSDDLLSIVDPAARHAFPTTSITSVIVVKRSQEPRTVYILRNAGPTVLLEGLDKLGQFTQQLSRIVGASRVRELKWWQLAPR